jgi:hypothetical protein
MQYTPNYMQYTPNYAPKDRWSRRVTSGHLLQVKILTGGLMKREEKLRAEGLALWEAASEAQRELACFRALALREAASAPRRVEQMKQLLEAQARQEQDLQVGVFFWLRPGVCR